MNAADAETEARIGAARVDRKGGEHRRLVDRVDGALRRGGYGDADQNGEDEDAA